MSAAAASSDTQRDRAARDDGANRGDGVGADRGRLRRRAHDLAGHVVFQQPLRHARGLRVGVLGLEQPKHHHRQQAQARQDAQIEVQRIQRALHDLRVGRQHREALLALGPVQAQVQVDVGLGADALQEPTDDLCFHHRSTCAKAARAVSSSAISTYSSAACACATSPGPKTTASIPRSDSREASVQ